MGKQTRERHHDVTRAGRSIDHHDVDARPARIFSELSDHFLNDESTPEEGLLLIGQLTHGEQRDAFLSDDALERHHFGFTHFDVAGNIEQACKRKASYVGIENADPKSALGECDRHVRGNRRFADTTLSRGNHENWRASRNTRRGSARLS